MLRLENFQTQKRVNVLFLSLTLLPCDNARVTVFRQVSLSDRPHLIKSPRMVKSTPEHS